MVERFNLFFFTFSIAFLSIFTWGYFPGGKFPTQNESEHVLNEMIDVFFFQSHGEGTEVQLQGLYVLFASHIIIYIFNLLIFGPSSALQLCSPQYHLQKVKACFHFVLVCISASGPVLKSKASMVRYQLSVSKLIAWPKFSWVMHAHKWEKRKHGIKT